MSAVFGAIHCGGNGSSSGAGDDSSGNPNSDGGTDGASTCANPAALSGDIVNACGAVDPKAYVAIAAQLGTDVGIHYRYGDACSGSGDAGAAPTWSKPGDQHFDNAGNGSGWSFQVGGPEAATTDKNLDDYASNIGQGIYVADAAKDPGVVDLTTYLMGRNTFAESPQLPWVYYGGGNPDVNVVDYQKTAALSGPITTGRCYGNSGWCANALIAFGNGMIVTAGSNTARNEKTFQLPAGKIPTGIAVTNNGEFALVTIWDTQNLKGQVAVIALAGMRQGYPAGDPNSSWWGEWQAVNPGLRNLGNIGFMKLLGFLDLPGMMAPTEISASADYMPGFDDQQGWMCSADGKNCRTQAFQLPLTTETNRQSFIGTGPNANRFSKSGFAVVISKSEKTAIFIDLKPLFQKVQNMYFGTPADFALTQTVGQPDNQWPFAFSYAPDFAPKIVSTVTLTQAPTSVRTSLETVNRAWIGTIDGTLHIYDVGGYGDNAKTAIPTAITEVGSVAIGKNPTALAYAKHEFGWTDKTHPIDKEVIAVSRGECKIDWVKFGATDKDGQIARTLRDSRLVDPISAENNDNHGTESYVLSVADYGGKQIAQYRYGPVIFWTNPGAVGNSVAAACQPPNGCGMGGSGTDPFEFGGAFPTLGKSFRVTSSNTP